MRRPEPSSPQLGPRLSFDLRRALAANRTRAILPPSVERFLARITDVVEPLRVRESVRKTVLETSANLTSGDFQRIRGPDLHQLFDLYDERAFGGCLAELLPGPEPRRPRFRFSRRMTKSAGLTTLSGCGHVHPDGRVCRNLEVALSSPLILGAFLESPDPITVVGLACTDRLDVLLRVLEHELVHVFEMAAFGASECSARPFRALSWALFGHTASRHRIISPQARAAQASGLRPGNRVRFVFEGASYEGVVNRITRRATVLVKSDDGDRYNDGHRYRKYYIPLGGLERLNPIP